MPEPASEPAYGEQNEALEPGVDRVLVIDDDRELCELVREYLVQECFYVDLIHEGRHGLEQALSGKYDVVILDVMLPGMNGLQVLQAIQEFVGRLSERIWSPERLELGDLYLDQGSRTCRVGGTTVELTTTEFDLLVALIKSSGRVISRKDLVRVVLDREFSPFDRSIDVHVSNLRKKLGVTAEGIERIRSIRNVGYLYTHHPGHSILHRTIAP